MRLLARRIIGELFEYRPGAGNPFLAHEAHGPAADILADRFERIGRRDPRRHDEAGWRSDFAERDQEFGVGFFQHPAEGAVIDGAKLLFDLLSHQAHVVARSPARDARHHDFCEHRLVAVKFPSWLQYYHPHYSNLRSLPTL